MTSIMMDVRQTNFEPALLPGEPLDCGYPQWATAYQLAADPANYQPLDLVEPLHIGCADYRLSGSGDLAGGGLAATLMYRLLLGVDRQPPLTGHRPLLLDDLERLSEASGLVLHLHPDCAAIRRAAMALGLLGNFNAAAYRLLSRLELLPFSIVQNRQLATFAGRLQVNHYTPWRFDPANPAWQFEGLVLDDLPEPDPGRLPLVLVTGDKPFRFTGQAAFDAALQARPYRLSVGTARLLAQRLAGLLNQRRDEPVPAEQIELATLFGLAFSLAVLVQVLPANSRLLLVNHAD